jgi:hypothetical protein
MTTAEALAYVEDRGVVLVSARGPVPRLTEAIIDEPIKGSWWAHPRSHQIFAVLQGVTGSEDVLVCRLVDDKVTLVHRRLWPALVRLASRFPPHRLAKVREKHTRLGYHVSREIPFPEWVPDEVMESSKAIGEQDAFTSLGSWSLAPRPVLEQPRRRGRPR